MTPDEVTALVRQEVEGCDEASPTANPHGVQLERCLVRPPERRTYLDSFNDDQPIELWLILEERPETEGGYQIVFDDQRGQFGLATPGFGETPVFIGYYGTFRETLAGM